MHIASTRKYPAVFVLLIILLVCPGVLLAQDPGHLQSPALEHLPVNLEVNNEPLHKALDLLSKEIGYYFTYDSRLVNSQQIITAKFIELPLALVIDSLLPGPPLRLQIINNNIVLLADLEETLIPKDTAGIDEQDWYEIQGRVFDQRSLKGLSFATVAVYNTSLGTITNDDGSFLLRISDTIRQPILVSSYIGYKDQYKPVNENNSEPVILEMSKEMISLQEVIIRYEDPLSLLRESIERVDDNYLSRPFGMNVYYREKVMKDERCLVFSEAVVDIAKSSYVNSMALERSRVLKGRKITNIDIQDTILLKIQSGLSSMLQLDIVKTLPLFLSEDAGELFDLQFSNVVSFKDKLVYVIAFKQKEGVRDMLFEGDLYIDRESLAILAADFRYDPLRLRDKGSMFVSKKSRSLRIRPLEASYHVEYGKTGEAYHLTQAQGKVRFRIRKRRQWIAARYQINIEMAVTNIDPGNPPRIRLNEKLNPSSLMSEQVFEYDPEFWGEYTTIAPETDLMEALKRIEKSMREISGPGSASDAE